ncbi:elongation factor P maturation arginine rhamnosyltransferase EarP [Chitinimonas naiadis]
MRNDWDIFCAVIDNFGDIGVCWRLARQIAGERNEAVRLWVDDLAAFTVLEPAVQPGLAVQCLHGVEIRLWQLPFPEVDPAAIVIEAFACNPPEPFLAAMAQQAPPPVWINLEYLSAEDWVEGCHALGSRHPRLPLSHHFFFPGFTAQTGGLLRERELLAQRRAWQQHPTARADFLRGLGLDGAAVLQPCVSLFCYDNMVLTGLLDAWQAVAPMTLLVADGKPRKLVEAWLGAPFETGQCVQRGHLTLLSLPFLRQADYDRLLWSCDLNFIRGEDSFVRAQWAARPLCWHIYPQEDAAHRNKLDAYLARYVPGLPDGAAASLRSFSEAWNEGDSAACRKSWGSLWQQLPALQKHAEAWCDRLSAQPDLLSQLARFAGEKRSGIHR